MQRSIALFDFDGTITTRDTLLEIIRYAKGDRAFLTGFALLSPWLITMKAGLLSNSEAKQKVLSYFFGGTPPEAFGETCEAFAGKKIPSLIRPAAMERIKEHQQNGFTVVVVSASPENVVEPWCRQHQLECIATRLEVKNQLLTGRINGNNCYGEEKVRRIRERFDIDSFGQIYAYGDSAGDKPMLALATVASYKPFRI
jgi:HAD superfamily hydrolase (TIGR01490 family)